LKVNANYTFTQVEEPLSRLIQNTKEIFLDYQATPRSFFTINYQFVDKRKDAFFDGGTFATTAVLLDSYQLVNAMAKYDVIKNRLNVFASVNNILNENLLKL
jgi:vitamin B12 transporter